MSAGIKYQLMSRFIRRPREVFYIAFNNRTAVRVSRLSLTVTEQRLLKNTRGGGVLLGILGGAVPPDSPNPDPISTKTYIFSTVILASHSFLQFVAFIGVVVRL